MCGWFTSTSVFSHIDICWDEMIPYWWGEGGGGVLFNPFTTRGVCSTLLCRPLGGNNGIKQQYPSRCNIAKTSTMRVLIGFFWVSI
ncbi:hypothetical protein FKM82_012364 [Ascaphus truei]